MDKNSDKSINNNIEKKDIRSLTEAELKALLTDMGEKGFRATQIFSWLHDKKVDDFTSMSNIPDKLRKRLDESYMIYSVKPLEILQSKLDGTRKYIMRLGDGNVIESVLLKYDYGATVCISSQVGCRMGCRFCASTLEGLVRNLTAGEMLGQIYEIEKDTGERVSHVVIMGSGEPMDNFDYFVRFYELITAKNGKNLSGRNITASTCGLVPRIRELADRKLSLTLALSLHAVTDEKRREIMPIANKYSLDEVISACSYYFESTGRRITLEYSLIAGQNDSREDAEGLIRIARSLNSHVNLIPVNPIKERDYKASDRASIDAFKAKLQKNHVNATVRREMGRDINGACGQLRRSYIKDGMNN